MEAGVTVKAHLELIHKVKCICKTLSQAQGTLAVVHAHLQVSEIKQLQMEVQLDLLVRMPQLAARITPLEQALPHLLGSGENKTKGTVRNLHCKFSVYDKPFLAMTAKVTINRWRCFVLNTANTTLVVKVLAYSKTWSPTS